MKRVLFIDRDGTLAIEPPIDFQLDSFEKLEFLPGVFSYLARIARELDFELVMVTNQDGLGTASFPEDTFWPVQNFLIKAFENEGVRFAEVLIDRSFPEENLPTRKPGTGLLNKYIYGDYDLEGSYVIGDRLTDMELAKNLGSQGLFIGTETGDFITVSGWKEIYEMLKSVPRKAQIIRTTKETSVDVTVNLDGSGHYEINTGLRFFDHMLEQLAKHSFMDLRIVANGDLDIDEHHTIEDVALTLGQAVRKAMGSKIGMERYGYCLPMDDCLVTAAIDFGGRPWFEWEAEFNRERVGDVPTEMFYHFFKSFSDESKSNIHIQAKGENEHHKVEAIFKGLAKAIRMAVAQNAHFQLPSTKGVL